MDRKVYSVVDLFCGCGGLSRGLERTGRFRSIFGVDIEEQALDTFVRNHGSDGSRPAAFHGDIRRLSKKDAWAHLRRFDIKKPGELDCLVGGPPCEGFSRNKVYTGSPEAGDDLDPRALQPKQYREKKYWQSAWQGLAGSTAAPVERISKAYNPFLEDPRNDLYRSFLALAQELRPKIILIENVRQMLSHGGGAASAEILRKLGRLDYVAEVRVVNAAEYGVPQLRHRVIFVAVQKSLVSSGAAVPWPIPSHAKGATGDLLGEAGIDLKPFVTVREAISDLPPARPERSVASSERLSLSTYARNAETEFQRFVRSQMAAPANHIYRTPSEQVMARLRAMRPGMKPHQLPPELQTKKYYYNAYGRLEWDAPANTITKSFLYPGSGKFGHPEEERIISYREAARLQSFDDDFTFHATSQEGLADMIGSAVPSLLGYRFGEQFVRMLESQQISRAPRARAASGSSARRV